MTGFFAQSALPSATPTGVDANSPTKGDVEVSADFEVATGDRGDASLDGQP